MSAPGSGRPRLVPFEAAHAAVVLELIGDVFAEYGMTFEPAGFDADLTAIREHYPARGGWFAVLIDGDRVVGTVAALPKDATTVEIKRLYLLPEHRGRGLGRRLLEHALDRAREAGFRGAVAWSDERLRTAHAVYDRMGFERISERVLEDIDRSREYGFKIRLG